MLGGLQWPKWSLYVESNKMQGEACDRAEPPKLIELLHQWAHATDDDARQPVTVGAKVRNVPEKGYWAWDPGGYIGLYKPDTFWMAE